MSPNFWFLPGWYIQTEVLVHYNFHTLFSKAYLAKKLLDPAAKKHKFAQDNHSSAKTISQSERWSWSEACEQAQSDC